MKILKKIPFISLLFTGWEFAFKGYPTHHYGYRLSQQSKIIFHTFLNPIFASKWFKILNSADFSFIVKHRNRLYIKPFRPYISIKWNKKQKVKVISDTYRFLKGKGDLFNQLLTNDEGKIIARLQPNDSHEIILRLGYDYRFRKEGEMILFLESEQLGGRFISVSFSFEEKEKDHWVCLIGCVQGHKINTEQYSSKLAQKLMFGQRPKALITYAIQEFSRVLGCSAIYGVGNSIQSFHQKHAIHLPWLHNINFDYDAFWQEVGGKSVDKGWFELPLIPLRKDMKDIKSKKRSMYRKRFNMLDNLSENILNSIKTSN